MTYADTWKLKRGSDILGQVMTLVPGIEQTKVLSKSLDGTVYIQTIGTGNRYVDVAIGATIQQLNLINLAEAEGALVSVTYRDTVRYGYIEGPPEWEAAKNGEYYTTNLKILYDIESPV